jgi:phosphonate transport system substrate-binding protein
MTSTAPRSFSIWNVLLLTLLAAVPVAAYFYWDYQRAKGVVEPVDYAKILTGYLKRQAPSDQLAVQFKDENGDLVADGPANEADRLNPDELAFSAGGFLDADTESVWRPFLDHLSQATGKNVVFRDVNEPRQLIEALNNGTIHITSFSTGFVPTAVNLGGFVPVAAFAPADGNTKYEMEIIVPAQSSVKNLADIKGHKLMLTSAGSHSGFKAPLVILRDELGLKPGTDYEFLVSGGHGQSIAAIARGRDFVAPVANDLLANLSTEGGTIKPDQFRSIYKSRAFPKGAWGYSCRLDPALAAKIRQAFLDYDLSKSPIGERLKGSGTVKFAPVDYKKDWEFVREIDAKMLKW